MKGIVRAGGPGAVPVWRERHAIRRIARFRKRPALSVTGPPPAARITALDGLRGVLAATVVVHHGAVFCGNTSLEPLTRVAVWVFFVLSGWVLTSAWDGRYIPFLLRRAVRLWPVHAVCLVPCALLAWQVPRLADITWFPWLISPAVHDWHMMNPTDWSMCIEVAAMPFMPAIVWFGRHGLAGLLGGLLLCLVLALALHPLFLMLGFFVLGAVLSRFNARFWPLETAVPQWLGRVSYSLYLSHWAVLRAVTMGPLGGWGVIPGLVLVPLVAWACWRWIERPSIHLSRRVARKAVLF